MNTKVTIAGVELKNPVMTASGTLDPVLSTVNFMIWEHWVP